MKELLKQLGFLNVSALVASVGAALWVLIHTKPKELETVKDTIQDKIQGFCIWLSKLSTTIIIAYFSGEAFATLTHSETMHAFGSIVSALGLNAFFKNIDKITIALWNRFNKSN